jgi:hypothetical protein
MRRSKIKFLALAATLLQATLLAFLVTPASADCQVVSAHPWRPLAG